MNGVDEVGSNLYIVHILLKFSGFSHFMEQISGLLQFGDLNALSGLELIGLEFLLRTWSLADLYLNVSLFSWAKFELAISIFYPLNFQLAVPNYGKVNS